MMATAPTTAAPTTSKTTTPSGFGPAMGGVFGLLAGNANYANPASGASKYLQQIPGTVTPYYQPYINAGQAALPMLQQQFTNLITNPGQQLSALGSGFQASPGYQYNVQQATNAANQAAAAGGMVGSPQEQQQLASTVSGLANQDYYNYLNHALGLYNTGLQGMGGINTMGYNASTSLADILGNNLQSQAALEYARQAAENQHQGGLWGGIGGLIGGLF